MHVSRLIYSSTIDAINIICKTSVIISARKMYTFYLLSILFFKLTDSLWLEPPNVENLKNCVQQTINKIFSEEDTLLFINLDYENVFPDKILNPYVIVDYTRAYGYVNTFNVISNKVNSVIHVTNYTHELLMYLMYVPLLPPKISPPPTRLSVFIIFIGKSDKIGDIFKHLWTYGFIDMAVITYNSNYEIKVFYSNPNAPENECGTKFDYFVLTNCNSNFTYNFPKIRRKYSSCKFTYVDYDLSTVNSTAFNKIEFVINSVAEILNMSLYKSLPNSEYNHQSSFYVSMCLRGSEAPKWSHTPVIDEIDLIWYVPLPTKLSLLEVFKNVFQPTVWLFILLSVLATSLAWWMLSQENYLTVLFHVYSISLTSSTYRLPTRSALRIIFVAYAIYLVYTQATITSNLVPCLAQPQFKHRIRNMRDLINSNTSILMTHSMYDWLKPRIKNIQKISKQIKFSNALEIIDVIKKDKITNVSVVLTRDHYYLYKENYTRCACAHFVDRDIVKNLELVLCTEYFSYFWYPLYEIVVILIEAGLIDKNERDFKFRRRMLEYRHAANDAQENVLGLHDVYDVFLIWGGGLVLAFLVFVVERIFHYTNSRT